MTPANSVRIWTVIPFCLIAHADLRCNEKEKEQVLGAGVRMFYMGYKITAGRKNRSIVRITAENNAIGRNHH